MTDIFRTFFLLLLILSLSSCQTVEWDEDDIVLAEVGPYVLHLSDVIGDIPTEVYAADSLKAIINYRGNWVNRKLKIRETSRLQLDQNPQVQRRIRQATESILVDAYNEAVYLNMQQEPVTRSEAQSYYESNKDRFILAERHVRFRHMITASLTDAQNARNGLLRGRSWSGIAETYSVNPQQALRISRQFYPVSTAAMHFEEMNSFLQVIGITEISPIRRIGDQFHFVQLVDARETGDHPQVDWVIDKITDWLELERRRKHLRSMEHSLLLKAQANNQLRIFDVNIPDQQIEIVQDSM